MKKSRIAIAVILAVVLAVTCVSVPTFSWFTRPQPESQSGANMTLRTNNAYNAYNGYGVTVSTMGSADSGINYSTNCNDANACSGSEIGIHNRKFFVLPSQIARIPNKMFRFMQGRFPFLREPTVRLP